VNPGEAFVQVDVGLGPDQGHLATAAGERAIDHDAAIGRQARGRFTFVPEQHLKLIDERRPQDRLLGDGDLLLVMLERRGGAGERRSAGAAVLVALVFVGRPDRERVSVADLTSDAACDERSAARLRQRVLDDAVRTERIDDRLIVVTLRRLPTA
jgi:hypothetical protein